jgi:putative heme degradation protein
MSTTENRTQSIVNIDVDEAEIKKRAETIAAWKNTFDVYIWLLAEAELRISQAFITKVDASGRHVKIDKTKIVDKPSESDIKVRAKALASHWPRLQDVHWFIAERQYIYDKVMGRH